MGYLQVLQLQLQTEDMLGVWLIRDSKLAVGLSVCLSHCVSPATDWRPVQGVPCASCPVTAGIGTSPCCQPDLDNWKKMDGKYL